MSANQDASVWICSSCNAPCIEGRSGWKLAPVLLDGSKRDNVVVKNRVDLDVTAQGIHVVGKRAEIEIVAPLDPGDVRLRHPQQIGKLRLRLPTLLPQFVQTNSRNDRPFTGVDLLCGAGAATNLFA